MKSIYGAMVALAVVTTGCATLVGGGTSQVVTISSTPPGAEVVLNGAPLGVTPIATKIKRQRDASILIRKEGFEPQQFKLQTTGNPWFWGNIILGGFLGSTTDGISGAVHEYSPDNYFITLIEEKATPEQQLRLQREMLARGFVLASYDRLALDIARGHGEYLDTLLLLLETRTENRLSELVALREQVRDSASPPELAMRIVPRTR